MKKISVGLPSRTLDYIGESGFALAGARQGGKVYFGVETPDGYQIFERDLASADRRSVQSMTTVAPGTLTTDRNGEWLYYSRSRAIDKYIDNPDISAPQEIGLVYRLKASGGGQEEALFDFRDPAFTRYRKAAFLPFCSYDGSRACVLTFDYDKSMIAQQCSDWLAYDKETYDPKIVRKPEDQAGRETTLRQLLAAPHIKPLLEKLGVSVLPSGKIDPAERKGISQLLSDNSKADWAVLLWQDGKPSAIPLKVPAGFENVTLVAQGLGNKVILISAMKENADGTPVWHLFTVNEADGTLSELAQYIGLPSSMQLSADESAITLVYSPYDDKANQIASNPIVRRIPLDGSAPSDTPLPGRFTSFLDIAEDAKSAVAQDSQDFDIYYIDIEKGTKTVLTRLTSEVGGLFYAPKARQAVYMENGLLFAVGIEDDPQSSAEWVKEDYFADVQAKVTEFLTKAGFTVPGDLKIEWEERNGMGIHEFAALGYSEANQAKPFLLRYDALKEQVKSLWFPAGYSFPVVSELTGGDLDAFDCERRVEEEITRLGWLSETKQKYQPDASPIYDDRTKSYVIVYRDGYWLGGGGDKDQWVFNSECTMRINKVTGEIEEFNINVLPEVKDQKLELAMTDVEVSIRNKGEQKIPEEAPVKFDTANYRLTIVEKSSPAWGPAKFMIPAGPRLCYEVDGRLQPENALIMTSRVDTVTGDVLGQLYFLPTNQKRELGL